MEASGGKVVDDVFAARLGQRFPDECDECLEERGPSRGRRELVGSDSRVDRHADTLPQGTNKVGKSCPSWRLAAVHKREIGAVPAVGEAFRGQRLRVDREVRVIAAVEWAAASPVPATLDPEADIGVRVLYRETRNDLLVEHVDERAGTVDPHGLRSCRSERLPLVTRRSYGSEPNGPICVAFSLAAVFSTAKVNAGSGADAGRRLFVGPHVSHIRHGGGSADASCAADPGRTALGGLCQLHGDRKVVRGGAIPPAPTTSIGTPGWTSQLEVTPARSNASAARRPSASGVWWA